jgi:ATPase subunit of ABC transporter with duplicated ATPase domains
LKAEVEFAEMSGYEAESEAAVLLNNLGITEKMHQKKSLFAILCG